MNIHDAFDTIVDATLQGYKVRRDIVREIANRLYADRRGGELADLYASDEFLAALEWQLS